MQQVIKQILDDFESKEIIVEGNFTAMPHRDIDHNQRKFDIFYEKAFKALCEEIRPFVVLEQIQEPGAHMEVKTRLKLIVTKKKYE